MIEFNLPLWTGVHDKFKETKVLPFMLSQHKLGYIYQTTPDEIQEEIEKGYADDGYNFITQPPGRSVWANWLGDLYVDYLVENIDSSKKPVVLDVGAGTTYIPRKIIEKGVDKYVIYDPALQEKGDDKLIINRKFFSKDVVDRKYDYIVSVNTLEHVREPEKFMDGMREALGKDGKVLIIFPDIEKQFENGDFNALMHEHVNYFTKESADAMFNSVGLDVIDWKSEYDTHFYILKLGEPKQKTMSEDFMEASKERFEANLTYLKDTMQTLTKSGKKIAFHGAGNGLNNLISMMAISDYKNMSIYDGDISKKGKFLTTCDIPIRFSEDESYEKNDVVFISALTFYDEIKSFIMKHHKMSDDKIKRVSKYDK